MIQIHDLRTLEVEHDLETCQIYCFTNVLTQWTCQGLQNKLLFKTIVQKYCLRGEEKDSLVSHNLPTYKTILYVPLDSRIST